MNESKNPLSDFVYAMVGLLTIALIIAIIVAVARPSNKNQNGHWNGSQEVERLHSDDSIDEADYDIPLDDGLDEDADEIIGDDDESEIEDGEEVEDDEDQHIETFLMKAFSEGRLDSLKLSGTLFEAGESDKAYPIQMILNLNKTQTNICEVSGYYRYESYPDGKIELAGECNLFLEDLTLFSIEKTEYFELFLNDSHDTFEGDWLKYKSAEDLENNSADFQKKLSCSLTIQ